MATTILGDKAAGSLVNFKVNGVSRDFLVVHQGRPSALYDTSFDDGTVLLMKDVYETRQWHSSNSSDYAVSTIHNYLNNEFLALIDSDILSAIKQVKIPYRAGPSGTVINSGANGLPAYVWLLGGYEVNWSTSTSPNFLADGATLSYFAGTGTSDTKRIGYLGGVASIWWLRSPNVSGAGYAWYVRPNGNSGYDNCSVSNGIRPALVLPSSLLVSDTGEVIANLPPSAPPSINVPSTVISTQSVNISWVASTDPDGDTITYILERQYNSGGFAQVSSTQELGFSEIVSASWNSVQYRVKAQDSYGNESGYTVSSVATVIHNQPPIISGADEDIGVQTSDFSYMYTVTDADGDDVSVTERVDGIQIASYGVVLGDQNTVTVGGNAFLVLNQGVHTLTISAQDTSGNVTSRNLTFTKEVDGLSITLLEPLPADAQPYRALIDVVRHIPAGATFRVEATNNPYDAVPTWEDCTSVVRSNLAYIFRNRINASPQYGMNVRILVERGRAIGECNVSGIEVHFE